MPRFAESIDAERLPSVIAVLARQVDASADAVSRLKSLLALYETFLRLVAGLAVGSLRSQLSTIPDDLARVLVSRLSHPTWDDWHRVAQRCAAKLSSDALGLRPTLDNLRALTHDLQKCRNDDGHAPVSQWAQSKYDEFAPRVGQALGSLPWLVSIAVEVNGGTSRLPIGREMNVDSTVKNCPDAFVVARLPDESEVSLYPFFVVVDRGPLVGVYTALTDSWKELRVVGLGTLAEAPHSQKQKKHAELVRFRTWCRYAERQRLLGELDDFDDEVATARRIFGRKQDLQEIVDALATDPVVFVEGAAGIGKSHLLRHLVRKLKSDRYRVVYWRFAESDAIRSSRLPFLKHLAVKLGQWYGPDGEKEGPRIDIDPSAWERVILEMLRTPAESINATVIVIDGLDECHDPWLRSAPFTFDTPGLHWVCSGRPTSELQRLYSREGCRQHCLRLLKAPDVSEWISAEAPELSARSQEVADSSLGLPEYLRRLFDDPAAATASNVPLPVGIAEFWKETIERSRRACSIRAMSVYAQVLTAIAMSVEPLDAAMLGALLRPGRPASENTAIDESLRALTPLLRSFEREGRAYFQPPHALLKEMLSADLDFRDDLESVLLKYSALVSTPTSDKAVAEWIARAGLRQLLAVGRIERALALACDFGWVQQGLFRGIENKTAGVSEEMRSIRRDRLGWFVETFDLLLDSANTENRANGSRVAAILRAIRAFPEALIEDGDQLLFQLLANGEAGPEWREDARSWLRNQTELPWVGWLELVSSTQPTTFDHLDIELYVPSEVASAAFEPDGEHILATHKHETASRWNLRTGRCVARVDELRGTLLGFSSDGDLYSLDGELLSRWSISSSGVARESLASIPGTYRGSWKHSDGSLVLAVQASEEALIVRARDLTTLATLPVPQSIEVACALTEATLLVSARPDDTPRVYTHVVTKEARPCEVRAFVVDTRTNTALITPTLGRKLEIRNLDTFEPMETLDVVGATWHTFYWSAAGPNADGLSAVSTFDGNLVLHHSGAHAVRVVSKVHTQAFGVAVAPKGTRVATWGQEGSDVIRVWNAERVMAASPQAASTVAPDDSPAFALAIHQSSENVFCLRGQHVELRRFVDGALQLQHRTSVRAVASVSGDGKWVAAVHDVQDNEACIFDAETAKRYVLVAEDMPDIDDLRLDDDGTVLEVHGADGETTMWTVPEGRRIRDDEVLPTGSARGRHFAIDRDASSFRSYADDSNTLSRRVCIYDWDFDISQALRPGDYKWRIHAAAIWWARSRITYATVASDGRVAIAVEDGSIYFLRFHTRVPFEPQIVR